MSTELLFFRTTTGKSREWIDWRAKRSRIDEEKGKRTICWKEFESCIGFLSEGSWVRWVIIFISCRVMNSAWSCKETATIGKIPLKLLKINHQVMIHKQCSKKYRKNMLFYNFVDEFSKLICCFLFSLIFFSTNQGNQRNEFTESTNKIFVDFTKFQRIFNEKFNESTKILKKSSNSLKFC